MSGPGYRVGAVQLGSQWGEPMDSDKRNWLMDIMEPGLDWDFEEMCDEIRSWPGVKVDRMVNRFYDGGLAQFELDS